MKGLQGNVPRWSAIAGISAGLGAVYLTACQRCNAGRLHRVLADWACLSCRSGCAGKRNMERLTQRDCVAWGMLFSAMAGGGAVFLAMGIQALLLLDDPNAWFGVGIGIVLIATGFVAVRLLSLREQALEREAWRARA